MVIVMAILAFLSRHDLLCGWLFSAAMSTMPQPKENCPYFVRWIHDWLQVIAANLPKYQPQRQQLLKAE
jgi:hypothetical protein